MTDNTKQLIEDTNNRQWSYSFLKSDRFASFLDLIPEAAILSNRSGQIILTNITARQLFQYSKEEFLKCGIEALVPESIRAIHPKMRAAFFQSPQPRFLEGSGVELAACKKNGDEFPMESALFAIQTDQGTIAVNLMRDISDKKMKHKTLSEYAFIDDLTHLPNRRYFEINLQHNASSARRHQGKMGILYMDLDGFKKINDTYGHQVGDFVLCEISNRLTKIARAEDFLARVGGDEFVFTIYPLVKPIYLETIAKRILKACKEPILIDQHTCHLSSSIGISINESDTFDEKTLIKLADEAMYVAKKQGGNCFSHAKP